MMKYDYWLIDVGAGCPWGYSFSVKTEEGKGDHYNVIEASIRAGLFQHENDHCGCGCHRLDNPTLDKDWIDIAEYLDVSDLPRRR